MVISILGLPLTFILQFLAIHSMKTQPWFLLFFARVHHCMKVVIYVTAELTKRIPLAVGSLIRYKHVAVSKLLFGYAYFYIVCMTCYTLQLHWAFRAILLSGDIETNPGPETLNFCSWNLNSIIAYDFLRISLIKAYNSVFNYDLIDIVETHIDSTVDDDKLVLEGHRFVKNNHPLDVKRRCWPLCNKSLPSKDRFDLVTLPECVVSEIQMHRKNVFSL